MKTEKRRNKICRKLPYIYTFLKSALFPKGNLSPPLRYTVVYEVYAGHPHEPPEPSTVHFRTAKEPSPRALLLKAKEMQAGCNDIFFSLGKELFFPYTLQIPQIFFKNFFYSPVNSLPTFHRMLSESQPREPCLLLHQVSAFCCTCSQVPSIR